VRSEGKAGAVSHMKLSSRQSVGIKVLSGRGVTSVLLTRLSDAEAAGKDST